MHRLSLAPFCVLLSSACLGAWLGASESALAAQRLRPGGQPAPSPEREPNNTQKTPEPTPPEANTTQNPGAPKADAPLQSQPKEAAPQISPAPTQNKPPQIPQGLTQSAKTPASPQKNAAPKAPAQKIDPSVSEQELRRRIWTNYYRPAHDPVRFQGTFRVGVVAGGQTSTNRAGRGVGLEIETGISKNFFSVAAALGAQFGRYNRVPLAPLPFHPEINGIERPTHPGYKTPASFNAGLRAGIGRLALQGTGFIDPRLGYEFSWTGVKGINGYRPTKVATSHGPSLRVDAGFLSMARGKALKYRRVFGASLGWNMTVGGIGTKLPTSHFVFLGLFAQMN